METKELNLLESEIDDLQKGEEIHTIGTLRGKKGILTLTFEKIAESEIDLRPVTMLHKGATNG